MNVTPLIHKSATGAYAGIRLPFVLIENRLPESSKVRTGLHTALETIDARVEQLLNRAAPSSDEEVASPDTNADREAIAQAVREHQPDVGELADPDLDVAEVQAQLQAKHAIEAREEAK